nr:FG-GAP-like repeat-containing protein [uncultured Allomuricauda sp.]
MPDQLKVFSPITMLVLIVLMGSCKKEKPKQEEAQLYNKYCASCHIAPKIEELSKEVWEKSVLPAMVARMDVEGMYQDPNEVKPGFRPKITLKEWAQLENYILSNAPEKLETINVPKADTLRSFTVRPYALDSQNGALITYLGFKNGENPLFFGDLTGNLSSFYFSEETTKQLYQGKTPVTWYSKKDSVEIISEVGILGPSELEKGKLTRKIGKDTLSLQNSFHRPVHTLLEDLNGDGRNEIVVSEFGNESGRLSLLTENESGQYDKKVLLNLPGAIRTVARDMNGDNKTDIVALMTQSNESITIFYQTDDLVFQAKKVLEFSPVYGTSWFELVDYNNDGLQDIVTVQGDNADISFVNKPYHGMRIHLNNGDGTYSESFFYPMYGATRVVSRDYDKDGDLDFALVSTFPNYFEYPELTFVYLENKDSENYEFTTNILEDPTLARWFLMDAADIDNDGDEDIVLSSLTLGFTPVPKVLSDRWKESNVDIVVLENLLH